MFQFSIKKEALLTALLTVSGAIDKKNALPILSNFLLTVNQGFLSLTATDLEIEISVQVPCDAKDTQGCITVPAKKLIDIIRSLDDHTTSDLIFENNTVTIRQESGSFKLATLPADNFPQADDECNEVELTMKRSVLLELLQSTHFALPQQDVRVFLNGLFIDFDTNHIALIAADGHRMAINHYHCNNTVLKKILLPKKGVQELLRLLPSITEEDVVISAGKSHFKLVVNHFTFISKLIEARFPSYTKAIPKGQDKHVLIDGLLLKRALSRSVILAHEKSKAITLHLQQGQITLIANNHEKEEAIETLTAQTQGDELHIGLNAQYIIDVLNYCGDDPIRLSMSTNQSSIVIESLNKPQYQYILMPMKI